MWRAFDRTPFEEDLAVERIAGNDVLGLLDHVAYFDLLRLPPLAAPDAVLATLAQDGLIRRCEAGGWDVTNLGAALLARSLSGFRRLWRKTVRVVQYRGTGRLDTIHEFESEQGYAVGFDRLVERIMDHLPRSEDIVGGLRTTTQAFPETAVRETVANALIHQDFQVTGTGPMVEIFDDRIEITSPGEPLVDPERFVDTPPKSRNEALASLMRRFGICEERGTGVDKVVDAAERGHLPPPLFETPPSNTRAVLFSYRDLRDIDAYERIRAVYQHACLRHVNRDFLTNTSLRERFGIEENNRAWVSRLIRAAMDAEVIVPFDPAAAPKNMRCVPWWAAQTRSQ